MVQMSKPEDRVTIKLGPSRYDTPRAIRAKVQEVIDEQPPSTGGGITEAEVQDLIDAYQPVTGGVGQAIGIPPGVPFAYVPPNLVNYPIDSLALYEINPDDYAITGSSGNRVGFQQRECVFSQDTSDVFGQGTDALLTYVEATDSLVAFSPSSGTVSSVSVNSTTNSSLLNGFFTTNGSLVANVSHSGTNSGNIPTYVYDGTTMTSITLTAPTSPSNHRCVATGPDETNTYITALWAVNTTGTQLVIRTYDLTGTQIASRTESVGTSTNLQAACGLVANGYIMFCAPRTTNNGVVYVREASTATQAWTAFSTQVQIPQPSMCIGSTGVGFLVQNYNNSQTVGDRIDILKIDFSNGVTTTYADALTGLIDPFTVTNTTIRGSSTGVAYIDDDNVAVTGRTIAGSVSPYTHTPIYCQATTATGGTISVTQTSFPDFASSLTQAPGQVNNYPTGCFSPFCLSDASVSFVIHQSTTVGSSPSEQWIENVAT